MSGRDRFLPRPRPPGSHPCVAACAGELVLPIFTLDAAIPVWYPVRGRAAALPRLPGPGRVLGCPIARNRSYWFLGDFVEFQPFSMVVDANVLCLLSFTSKYEEFRSVFTDISE